MAITTNALVTGGDSFGVNAYGADVSAAFDVKAAPASGAHYISALTIATDANITVTIAEGASVGVATNILVGPVGFGTAGGIFVVPIKDPIKLTDLYSLVVDASAAGNVCIVAVGFTR